MAPRGKVGNNQHFPTNLHILLDEAEKANHHNIVSWCSGGRAFKIHDQDELVPLLQKYFRQTKFKSFLRQLQSYDFHRITRGSDKGIVSHPLFVRGRRSMCFKMSRKQPGGHAVASRSDVPHSMNSSSNMLFQLGAVPTSGITPIRKAFSAPMLKHSNQHQGNAGFHDLCDMKNKHVASSFQPLRVNSGISFSQGAKNQSFSVRDLVAIQEKRRSPPSVFSSNVPVMNNTRQARRSTASAAINVQQSSSVLKCTETDYRSESTPEGVRIPIEAYLLIKESPAASGGTNQHTSQQQFIVQSQHGQVRVQQRLQHIKDSQNQVLLQFQYQQKQELRGEVQAPMQHQAQQEPRCRVQVDGQHHALQHHNQETLHQVQHVHAQQQEYQQQQQEPFHQVHQVHGQHQTHQQQQQEPFHQVQQVHGQHQTHQQQQREPLHQVHGHRQVYQQQERLPEHHQQQQQIINQSEPQVQMQQQVAEQIKQLKQNFECDQQRVIIPELDSQQGLLHHSSNQFQHQQANQQAMQNPQLGRQQQQHLLQQKEKVHQHHPQAEHFQVPLQHAIGNPQESTFVPRYNLPKSEASTHSPNLTPKTTKKTTAPCSNEFDLSFSSTEFLSMDSDDSYEVPIPAASNLFSWPGANTAEKVLPLAPPSPSVELVSSSSLARATPCSCDDTNDGYGTNVHYTSNSPPDRCSFQTREVGAPASLSQQQQHQQKQVGSAAATDLVQLGYIQHQSSSLATTTKGTIDTGTVDDLLQNGTGGCDEWEIDTSYYHYLNLSGIPCANESWPSHQQGPGPNQ